MNKALFIALMIFYGMVIVVMIGVIFWAYHARKAEKEAALMEEQRVQALTKGRHVAVAFLEFIGEKRFYRNSQGLWYSIADQRSFDIVLTVYTEEQLFNLWYNGKFEKK